MPRESDHTILICALAALAEGYDLQSAGIVAPRLAKDMALTSSDLGLLFTAGSVGLFVGALVGGRVADVAGRKVALVGSLLMFGALSVASGLVRGYDALFAAKALTGFGLGGALPCIVALTAEQGPAHSSAARVTKIAAVMPLGGAGAVLLSIVMPMLGWRGVFIVGGVLPLAIAGVAICLLPSDRVRGPLAPAAEGRSTNLLSRALIAPTLALWASSFCVLFILYVMLNWLPMLMESRGADATLALAAALGFALSGAFGAFCLGHLLLRARKLVVLALAHVGVVASFLAVLAAERPISCVIAFSAAGFFVVGCQFLLYGLSGNVYDRDVRSFGVGAAVASGRLGGIVGPALVGFVMSVSGSSDDVVLMLVPVTLLSLLALISLSRWQSTR